MSQFHLQYNYAANRAIIISADEFPPNGYDWVSSHDTLAEAKVAREALRGETRWAVMEGAGYEGELRVYPVDNLSGPTTQGHTRELVVFPTKEEAEKYLAAESR